uniref:Fibronectin type-III domain-containing protein n=1 Tax=Sinocyclocheilus anshuiensis TaxID=1608454 RepID=A0A671L9B7_9TELE
MAYSSEGFSHFQVKVSDSGQLLEPQEFIVPGNQTVLDVLGLITGIGFEVSVTGVSGNGLQSRPITTVAVTGTALCFSTARHSVTSKVSLPNHFKNVIFIRRFCCCQCHFCTEIFFNGFPEKSVIFTQ